MRRTLAPAAALALAAAGLPGGALAQAPRMVKVVFEFRQEATASRDAAGASGRVVITERGGVRSSGRAGVESTERRVRQTTGIFTLVQDGGESTLLVASQVPYPQVAYYQNYLTGAGYVAAGVAFRDVGTSLRVRATILPGDQVRLRLTPSISWFAADRSGAIEVNEASTEIVVPSGRRVVLGGSTTETHEVLRQILGYGVARGATETLMRVTATIR